MNRIRAYLPILEWLPQYRREYWRGDIVAGATVGIMLVPQGMAYALLAGLPPIYGLYASIVPLIVYAIMGTSRQLSVGPVALASLLVLTGVGHLAEPGTAQFIALAISVSLIAGLMQLLFGFFRLGFFINFLSHPVLSGFTSAAAVIIALSQLKNLLGIPMPRTNLIQQIVNALIHHIHETNLISLAIGVSGIVIIALLKRINRNLPTGLMIIIPGTLIVWGFDLMSQGVGVVGDVPRGLPEFQWPQLTFATFRALLPLGFTIFLISFIESLAIAKALEARHNDYKISPNQELIALGLGKFLGAFFQCYPTTGSFSRSAVNDELGAKSNMSSVVAVSVVALTLLFFTPLLYYLPTALFGSIIVVAVYSLVDYKEAIRLWRTDKRDFITMMVTFVLTITMGIQDGVLIGVLLSLAIVIYRNSRPHFAVLGKLPLSGHFRNVNRFPEAIQEPDVLIMRFDSELYFGNCEYFKESMEELVAKKGPELKVIILDAAHINDLDSTAYHMLDEMVDELKAKHILFFWAGTIGPVRDRLFRCGMMQKIGLDSHFMNIDAALAYYHRLREDGLDMKFDTEALQTNEEEGERGGERGSD